MSQSSEKNVEFKYNGELSIEGSIVKSPEYECPKHGNVGDVWMTFEINAIDSNPEINRRYCMNCMVEKYDEIGIEQLTEIKES